MERIFNERFPNCSICREYSRELVWKFTIVGGVKKKEHKSSVYHGGKASLNNWRHDINTINVLHQLTEDEPDRRTKICQTVTENMQGILLIANILF